MGGGMESMDESNLAIKRVGSSEVKDEDASSNAGNDTPNEMQVVEEAARPPTSAAPGMLIGGEGGTLHDYKGWIDGKVITRIRVYSGYSSIQAYTIWLTDSESVTYGSPGSSNYAEYTFESGERLTSLTLWGNGNGTRAGWIEFTTSRGNKFSYGMHGWGRKTPYYPQLGSGILVGYIIRSSNEIDAHGFWLLNEIDYAELTNIGYPTLSFDTGGIVPKVLDRFQYKNNSTTSREWDFTRTMKEKIEETWGTTVDVSVHAHITVTAGIPLVAEVSGEFGWEVGVTSHYEKSQKTEQEFHWSVRGKVEPGHKVDLKAVTRIGKINTPYGGLMWVRLKNGAYFSYTMTGTYKGISYTGVEVIDDSTQ